MKFNLIYIYYLFFEFIFNKKINILLINITKKSIKKKNLILVYKE